MADVTRRGFLGFLASLPLVGKLLPDTTVLSGPLKLSCGPALSVTASVRPTTKKYSAIALSPPVGTKDRLAWLKTILQFDTPPDFIFSVTMPCCGHKVVFHSLETMPLVTVACPCGRPGFNVVEWPLESKPVIRVYNAPDEGGCEPVELHWDYKAGDIWTRTKGSSENWTKHKIAEA